MADKARLLAVNALMRVSAGGFSNIVIDSMLEESDLEGRDRTFAGALFYGTLERRITLDYLIKCYSKKPKNELEPEVLETLRMGFYQILYMKSVTDMAAVDESVKLIKALGFIKASGYVNGVLRNFLRDGKEKAFGSLKGFERMSAAYSVPVWLCKMWTKKFGSERTIKALAASAGTPPLYLRCNSLRIKPEGLVKALSDENVKSEIYESVPGALVIESAAPQNTAAYKNGYFHVQDISSQICAAALDAKKGMRVLDICAAPGGKTFTMAEMMENNGEIVSCDLHPQRAKLIRDGAMRLGLNIVKAMANDATKFNEGLGLFDRVLCDVPCSGLGVIRRKPEIRYKNPDEIKKLPPVQFKIASESTKYLKDDGILIYSTCTLSDDENEAVVSRLMRECGMVPAELPENIRKYSENGYSVTLLPGEKGSDGFFFAALRKKGSGD